MSNVTRQDAWLYEDEDFLIEHSVFYRIAGLVFVSPKADARMVAELPRASLRRLGGVLAAVERVVAEVMAAENVYVARFGESGGPLHFHVFPRTPEITAEWRAATGSQGSIDAPALVSWANRTYTGHACFGDIPSAIVRLRERLAHEIERNA